MIALLASSLSTLPLSLRLRAFGLLERLAPSTAATPEAAHAEPTTIAAALWVYVSTIGELNAVEPFIDRLLAELGEPPLLLISDRTNYAQSFLAKYPHARLATLDGSVQAARTLVQRHPPLLLLVAEIPARLHDAPCRFAFATVHAACSARAPVVLVNGWLYGYAPPSRMDALEHRLFAADYLQAFDLMLVQTDEVRQTLLAHGAAAQRVVVTGNLKFDALTSQYAAPADSPLRRLLRQRRAAAPVIVAGSVTETADQAALLTAFAQVLQQHPQALFVLAPRHPENQPRMAALGDLLKQSGMAHRYRSQHDANEAVATSVLVLDTMGELRGCYAECSLAFVGTDHNVLEPLAFAKPVFVGPGWVATYPSFPVYQQMLAAGALHAVPTLASLGRAWVETLAAPRQGAQDSASHIQEVLSEASGVVQRNMAALRTTPVARLFRPEAS